TCRPYYRVHGMVSSPRRIYSCGPTTMRALGRISIRPGRSCAIFSPRVSSGGRSGACGHGWRQRMQLTGKARVVLMALLMACLAAPSVATAQITTGTIAGTVQDSSGGVIPGATVVLISESRGTRGVPAVTSGTGDYVFPNTTPDTYTIEVTMPGFRTTRRTGVPVSGGDRVTVPTLVIEPGGAQETIEVTAEAPLIQAQSGERSFAVTTAQVESLPMSGNRNFASLVSLVPGVVSGGASAGGTRLGGAGQNNIMMDGISAMDTGNNGQMLQMNV